MSVDQRSPEPTAPRLLAWGAALGIGLSWALTLVGSGHVGMDEVGQLAQAWRVAQGARLYQDAWEFAAPLPPHAMALVYAWTGPSLDLARAVAGALALATVWALRRLARDLGAGPWAATAAVLVVAWGCTPWARIAYHHWWAQAFLACGLALLAHREASEEAWWPWLGAALLLSLAGLSTQSLAPVGLAAWLLAWALAWAAQGLARPGQVLAGGLVIWALPWAAFALHFAWLGDGWLWWRQLWWWPWHHYRQPASGNAVWPVSDWAALYFPLGARAEPYPVWLARVASGVGAALALPWMAAVVLGQGALRWRSLLAPQAAAGRLQAVVGFAVVAQAWLWFQGRSDMVHAHMAAPLALVLGAAWASEAWRIAAASALVGSWPHRQGLLLLWGLAVASGLAGWGEWRWLHREGLWHPGGLDAWLRQDPGMVALAKAGGRGRSLFAFPLWGPAYLLGGARPATRFMLLTPQGQRYHGPEEYAAFRADWAQAPPDLVAVLDHSASEAVLAWGGAPDLRGYRLVHQGRTRMGSGWVPLSLWRQEPPR